MCVCVCHRILGCLLLAPWGADNCDSAYEKKNQLSDDATFWTGMESSLDTVWYFSHKAAQRSLTSHYMWYHTICRVALKAQPYQSQNVSSQFNSPHALKPEHLEFIIVWMRLTGVLPSDRVVMLIDMLIFSDEEEREGGEGLLFSNSCLWRKSRHARWILQTVLRRAHRNMDL